MKKILIAALLGGITAFIWGWVSWGMLPWHNSVMPSIPNEDATISHLQEALPSTGVYAFPGYTSSMSDAEQEAVNAKYKRGPYGMIVYSASGVDMWDPMIFIQGLVLSIIMTWILAVLLSMAGPRLGTYSSRVFFSVLVGVLIALNSHFGNWIWMGYPTDYTMVNAADTVLTVLFVGLVISAIMKPSNA